MTRNVKDWFAKRVCFHTEFDEGHLSRDPIAAQEEINAIVAIMDDMQPPVLAEENIIRHVFQITWDRVKKVLGIALRLTSRGT